MVAVIRPKRLMFERWRDQVLRRLGEAEGNRTPDLRIANATLSQLSYGPNFESAFVDNADPPN